MPVKVEDDHFVDDRKRKFSRQLRDGITFIYPELPTSWFHYRERFEDLGFRRFMIDLSGIPVANKTVMQVLQHFDEGETMQHSTGFNMKLGLR